MKKVLIKIRGTQFAGGQSDNIEFTTEGTMRKDSGDYVLCYNEGEIMGKTDIKTRLIIKGNNGVILERKGDLSSRLIIEKGVRNSCFYSVPEGDITLGIYGKTIKNNLQENGGNLKMVYTIDTNLQPISENTVEISVREVKNNVSFS